MRRTIALLVVAAGSAWGHFFYPAYLPLVACVALMLTHRPFWDRVREQPILLYGMGFVACCVIHTANCAILIRKTTSWANAFIPKMACWIWRHLSL